MLIRIGQNSVCFISELLRVRSRALGENAPMEHEIPAVFRGTEEITATPSSSFWRVFCLFSDLYSDSDGRRDIRLINGNPMERTVK